MADPVRGWLDLQRDLGGDEAIFDIPIDLASALRSTPAAPARVLAAPVASGSTGHQSPSPGLVLPAQAIPGTSRPFGDPDAAWRKAAPPIPGPGLAVAPPAGSIASGASWPTLEAVAGAIAGCRGCPLCEGRTQTVPGEGNQAARLMCVGEGPGESEDLSGRPFVGRAGELLDKILANIELPRSEVYIANVVKCRPPRNRAPLPDERAACLPYLHRQIALVRPRVLLALGSTAAEALLGVKKSLGELRLKVHTWDGIPLVVTYHPAALLRNPNWKRPAWDDVRIARQLLELDA